MQELFQELGLLMTFLSGARMKTPPNLLLLFQWGVLFVMLGRVLFNWARLEKLADMPDAPTGRAAAELLHAEMRKWWRRGCTGVGMICMVYLLWLVGMEGLMSEAAMYIGGMWAISLWLLNGGIHRICQIQDIPTRQKWTQQLRNMSMSLMVFVIYCMLVQNLSIQFISEIRRAYYAP